MSVYFIRNEKADKVKIGFTRDQTPDKRLGGIKGSMRTLGVDGSEFIYVAAFWPGVHLGVERALHHHFLRLRLHGEWFQWDASIASVMQDGPSCWVDAATAAAVRKKTPGPRSASKADQRRVQRWARRPSLGRAKPVKSRRPRPNSNECGSCHRVIPKASLRTCPQDLVGQTVVSYHVGCWANTARMRSAIDHEAICPRLFSQ